MGQRDNVRLEDATEDLLGQVLPVLLARMQRASEELGRCTREFAAGARGAERTPRGGHFLEEVQAASESLGWILGVLACAAGDDLLLARREPYGLALVADVVGEVLASEGRALEPDASGFPDVAPRLEDGWRLPWCVGLLLRLAARQLPPSAPVRWRLERGALLTRLWFPGTRAEGTAGLLADLESLLPGSRASIEADGIGMEFPADWFAATAGGVPA